MGRDRDGDGTAAQPNSRQAFFAVAVPFPFPFPFRPWSAVRVLCLCSASLLSSPLLSRVRGEPSQSQSQRQPALLLGGVKSSAAGRSATPVARSINLPPASFLPSRQDCRRQRRDMRMRVLPASWSSSSAKHSSGSSESHPSSSSSSSTSAAAAVYLNIYDISPLNHYLYWFGLGIFHSGIEVHGMEYGFGAHEYPTSGVFQVEPKSCPGFIFRRSVCVGTTHMSRSQVHTSIEDLAEDYHGDTYHLIIKNCNHFTADVCKRLTGKPVPGWVNRLARLGSFFNCVLPDSINVSAVRDVTMHPDFSDDDLGSNASILEGSDDDDLDQLLRTPNSDIVSSRDKTLTPGRDSL